MNTETKTYAYFVVLELTHKKGANPSERHELHVISYSMSDALMQALYDLNTSLNTIVTDTYNVNVLSIGPDFAAITQQIEAMRVNDRKGWK